jgi:hypothetical protein
MARYIEPTEAEIAEFAEWLAERPPVVQELAARLDPWSLFLLKTTGQRVAIVAYGEDGTVRVEVSACVNPGLLFDRTVFGINPDDLEPCDIPDDAGPHEPILSAEDVVENIDALRVLMRPDLFEMGADGTAIRRT